MQYYFGRCPCNDGEVQKSFNSEEINLLEAAQDGKLEFIRNQLISLTSRQLQDACKKTDFYGRNALHYVLKLHNQAAFRGHYEVVEYFLDLQSININSKDNKGNSALMLACVRGYNADSEAIDPSNRQAICQLLLERGATLTEYKKSGINNPLHWTCFFGDKLTSKILMQMEPSLMLFTNERDQFPIDLVLKLMNEFETGNREEIIQIKKELLEYMVIKFLAHYLNNEEQKQKLDCLDSPQDQENSIIYLNPPKITEKSKRQLQQVGVRYLFWSSNLGREDLVISLLKCNYSPFEPSYKGRNALHAAVYSNHLDLVKLFLEKDEASQFRNSNVINIMTQDKPQTALHIAVESGNLELVQYLISKGANPNIYNFRNHRAFDQSRLPEIKELNKKLMKNDEKNYIRSGYNHVLVGWQRDKNDLLEQQFKNIEEKLLAKRKIREEIMKIPQIISDKPLGDIQIKPIEKNQFRYRFLQSIDEQFTYYVLKVDPGLKNEVAHETNMMVYNSREGYVCPFNIDMEVKFENFHHIHDQQILLKLIYDEFDIDQFINDKLVIEQFPIHDDDEKQAIFSFWRKERFQILREPFQFQRSSSKTFSALQTYFGAEVGFFFVFVCFLSTWLFLPAFPGVIIAIYSYFNTDVSQSIQPIYTLLMAVWASIFFEFWKRKQSETMYNFDMHVTKEQRRTIPQFRGSFIIEDVTHTIEIMDTRNMQWKYFKSNIPLVLLAILLIIAEQYGYYHLDKINHDSTFYRGLWACILACSITLTNEIFNFFAIRTLNYENHQYQDERENAYIMKIFIFTFLNCFCRLFYSSIISPDNNDLNILSLTFTITWSTIHLIRYTIYPFIVFGLIRCKFSWDYNYYRQNRFKKQFSKQRASILDTENSGAGVNKSFDRGVSSQFLLHQIELNRRMINPPNHVEQFTFFITQFCMVTMFSAGSQFVAIAILFFNIINIEGLFYGYIKCRKRPLAEPKKSIGVWNDILQLIGYIGIVINCLTIYQANQDQLNRLIGQSEQDTLDSTNLGLRNFLLLIVAEHIVIGIKFVIEGVIPDEPEWIELILKKEEYLQEKHALLHEQSLGKSQLSVLFGKQKKKLE